MSISSSLCQGVDNLFDSPTFLACLVIVFISLILQSCVIGIPSWSKSETSQLGLWTICSDSDVLSCCDSVSDSIGSVPGWLAGTQALQCISFTFLVTTVVLLVVFTCVTECLSNIKVYVAIMVSCIGSAFFTFVSLITFGDNFRNSDPLSDHHLHGCFFVAIAVLIFLIIAITILATQCRSVKSSSDVSPEDRQTGTSDGVYNRPPVEPSAPPPPPPPQATNTCQVPVYHTNVPVPRPQQSVPARDRPPAQPPGVVSNPQNECVICMDASKDGMFNPCSHMACCQTCANELIRMDENCPICRRPIQSFTRVYNA